MRVASGAGRPAPFHRRRVSVLVVLSLLVFVSACSSGRKPIYPVKGQVLVNGKPAANAQILFHPAEDTPEQLCPTGHTDDEGYFTLTSYVKGDGAPEGNYNVTVTWFRVWRGNRADADVLRYNALPQHYAQPNSSPLHAKVNKGKNDLPALQLWVR